MGIYYDGTKLLSLKDVNGNKPEIFICTTNRSGGKTTYFNRLAVRRFLKKGEKFGLIFRYKDDLDDVANTFFSEIGELFFPDYVMRSAQKSKGMYHELWIAKKEDDVDESELIYKHCGYALALNSADKIKRKSHLLSDISALYFDEFQSETDNYCPKEVRKFKSIHTSIARGEGKQSRYLPVYMIANPVTLLNPYYTELGIATKLRQDTHFYRGNGFVLEQGFNESASKAQSESAFNRSFASSDVQYRNYIEQGIYLNDNVAFLEKPSGRSRYICTIKYNDDLYGIRSFIDSGVLHCDTSYDDSFKLKIAVTTNDHNVGFTMLGGNMLLITHLRNYFEKGMFRFRDLNCKRAIMETLAYHLD